MNLLLRLFAVGTLLTAAHTFAADAFEGKVTLTMSDDKGRTHDMNYVMKGHKLRMDMITDKADAADDSDGAKEKPKKHRKLLPAFLGGKSSDDSDTPPASDSGKPHQISTIMDMDKMEMLMLMPEQNMYMVMPIKKAVDKAVEHADKNGDSHLDIERTGKTEKILGYTCDQIIVTDTETKTVTEMWVAPNLGMFMGLGSGDNGGGGGMFGGHKSATAAKWEEVLKGKSGFPMRVISHDPREKETFKMEATKIEPGAQPDSLFVPPPDYKKFQMPDLGSLFRQG